MGVFNFSTAAGVLDRRENTMRFYRDVRKYHYPSREREAELFDKIKNGTPEERESARDEILLGNQRLVVSCAKQYASPDNLLDYVNEANIALMEAMDKYERRDDVKFTSYAIWYIKRALNNFKAVTIPIVRKSNVSKTYCVMRKAIADFYQRNERMPTEDELLDAVNDRLDGRNRIYDRKDVLEVSTCQIDGVEDPDQEPRSFECEREYNRRTQSENGAEAETDASYNRCVVEAMLKVLTPRERTVIKLTFGIGDDGMNKEHTPAEIGSILKCSTERVRQMVREIKKKLRSEGRRKVYECGMHSI